MTTQLYRHSMKFPPYGRLSISYTRVTGAARTAKAYGDEARQIGCSMAQDGFL
jgi:hypothetical protein